MKSSPLTSINIDFLGVIVNLLETQCCKMAANSYHVPKTLISMNISFNKLMDTYKRYYSKAKLRVDLALKRQLYGSWYLGGIHTLEFLWVRERICINAIRFGWNFILIQISTSQVISAEIWISTGAQISGPIRLPLSNDINASSLLIIYWKTS